ncbi:pseudouridine synthase [Marinimicrobium sp. ARAG 43.8]|uniref:pseudouridine synthase n=1 Tax=Marinimicrobium sp. ARAG 43.8 TaxID=3418719 RepID=UPI003CEEBE2C
MRLDRFVSQCSGLSRKAVKIALRAGRISVNAHREASASLILKATDEVLLDNRVLHLPSARYLMLHKPAGVICATEDPAHQCVIDLLPAELAKGLKVAGRLDIDTTGLVLLTDDGDWNHRLTSPRRACPKVYEVTTADPIAPDTVARFAEGLLLKSETKPTRPAELTLIAANRAQLVLHEGRYHQAKRMFAAVGNRVTALHRSAIGNIQLDPQLNPGDYRSLTATEVASV